MNLAKTDLKLMTEGSILGYLWYILNPLLFFVILFFVFSNFFSENIDNYALYILLGLLLWVFFLNSTTMAVRSMNNPLIKSINFPLEILVVSKIIASMFLHFFSVIIFVLFLIWFNIPLLGLIYYIPIFILFFFFVLGISFFISSINIYFDDLEKIWSFFTKLLFFATPIFYSLTVESSLFVFNLYNPIYYFITGAREFIIFSSTPQLQIILGMVGYSAFALFVGYFVFYKLKNKFAELI